MSVFYSDWHKFNEQFAEDDDERAERLRRARIRRRERDQRVGTKPGSDATVQPEAKPAK
jgi:hypothetical protein